MMSCTFCMIFSLLPSPTQSNRHTYVRISVPGQFFSSYRCILQVCPAIIDGRECGFRTESSIALETHMSTSHFNRAGRYCCARCDYTCAHPSYFRNHVLEKHGLISVVVRPEAFFTCKMCLYETNNSQARLDVSILSYRTANLLIINFVTQ